MNSTLVDYQGFKMAVRPDDNEHQHFYIGNRPYEPHVAAHFTEYARGKNVLDIGASIGYYTLLALQNGAKKVVAVEPTGYLVVMLVKSLDANAGFRERCRVINVAASDYTQRKRFNQLEALTSNGEIHPEGNTSVEAARLDIYAYTIGKIDVIKIDVEGHEERAMLGMSMILANNPTIFTEFYPRLLKFQGTLAEDYLRRLFKNRKVWVLDKWTHKKVRCETPNDVMEIHEAACKQEGAELAYLDLLSVYG